jgi:hypothetical protein
VDERHQRQTRCHEDSQQDELQGQQREDGRASRHLVGAHDQAHNGDGCHEHRQGQEFGDHTRAGLNDLGADQYEVSRDVRGEQSEQRHEPKCVDKAADETEADGKRAGGGEGTRLSHELTSKMGRRRIGAPPAQPRLRL